MSWPPAIRWRELSFHPLARALAISVAAHLVLFGVMEIGYRLGLVRRSALQALISRDDMTPRPIAPQPAHPEEPSEVPIVFVDVDPAQASPSPPKTATYYSTQNSVAANPDPTRDTDKPKINGKQEVVPATVSNPRPEPQPAPQPVAKAPTPPVAQPLQPQAPAAEPSGPKPGDLAMNKPSDQPGDAPKRDPAPPPRPRTLEEARNRTGLASEPMKQEGGVRRNASIEGFDAKATPFGSYDYEIILAIQRSWFALLDKQEFYRNYTGKVVVTFQLNADGTVTYVTVAENEVTEVLGLVCTRAVRDAAPFKPWPSDMRRLVGADFRLVRFTFHFN